MMRDSSKRQVKVPIKFEQAQIKKKTAPSKLFGVVALLACLTSPTANMSTPAKKTTKRKQLAGNTPNSLGNKRSTPNLGTYKLVEERLRENKLWDQAVAFHSSLDLLEIDNLAFTRRRERIRMHRNEDGSIKTHPDGTARESSPTNTRPLTLALTPFDATSAARTADLSTKSRPKAFGQESCEAEYNAAMLEDDHPEYRRLMDEHGYAAVLAFVKIQNPSWSSGDVSRFILVRALLAGHILPAPC